VESMETWILKVKISVLWIFTAVAFLVDMTVSVMEPGMIQQVMAGEIEGMQVGPEILLLLAILFLVPLIMAFLSLTLKDSVNRWTNIIFGIVYAGFFLIGFIETLAQPSAHTLLLEGAIVVAAALIVRYAWKWPKQQPS